MLAKTLIHQFPNQSEGTMDGMNDQSGCNLGPLAGDGTISLRLWDMDSDTSTVRWLVRNRIVQILRERPAFRDWEHEQIEKFARLLDEVLLQRAPSQVHYMNLGTLESRLNGRINEQNYVDFTNNLACDATFSSNGSTAQTYEMSHNMDMSSPDTSYNNASTSTSSSDCATASSDTVATFTNNSSASSSLLVGGSTVSRRYLPNGHHRVVASESIATAGNAVHCPETILQTLPVVSKSSADDEFSTVIPPNEYVGYWNNHVLNNVGCSSQSSMSHMSSSRILDEIFNGAPSFATNTDHTVDGTSLSEQCDNHLMPRCKIYSSVKLTNHASSFGLTGTFRNVPQSGLQSYLRMKSVTSPSLCSEKEQLLRCIRQEQLQPSQPDYLLYNQSDELQHHKELYSQQKHLSSTYKKLVFDQPQSILNWSRRVKGCVVQNQSCDQSDQPQLQRKEQYQQQLSMENRKSGGFLSQRILNGYKPVNNCVPNEVSLVPNEVSMKSQTEDTGSQQFLPTIGSAKRNLSVAPEDSAASGRLGKPRKEEPYAKFHKLCLLYHHALRCTDYEGKCEDLECKKMKLILGHISLCSGSCSRKDCSKYKELLTHWRKCHASTSGICGPDEMSLENTLLGTVSSNTTESMVSSPTIKSMEHEQPPLKRTKSEDPFNSHKSQNEASKVSVPVEDMVHSFPEGNTLECQELSTSLNTTPESMEMDTGPSSSSSQDSHAECYVGKTVNLIMDIKMKLRPESSSLELTNARPEKENMQVPVEADKVIQEGTCMNNTPSDVRATETKLRKLKKGVSLIDSFTPEKIREHVNSLMPSVGQSKEKTEKKQVVNHATDVNTCSLCGMKDLYFDPPARYCAACYKKINPKGICYSMNVADGSDQRTLVCRECFNNPCENVNLGGKSILKANLRKIKNYAETEELDEWWVHCDKCDTWQHQICTLFNSTRHEAVQADHNCPNCILQEIESGEHQPLLQSTIPGAKELPITRLSDYIEKWVSRRLEEERQERASSLGKSFSEVPAAEGLVVRVVSSVVKQLEVKKVFRDIFQDETYPSEFPYKSKAILLFQNIDGADVCLFGMYVQEYGSGCADPNRRRVCISYIDSVKYFRPKIIAVTGEALRTFVYHEILIGYLDYCKKRGFTSCYIWACPPLKRDDDYILYCHPKIQKMPKSEKLREWYQTIIRKAAKKEIVAEYTNLYDHFFVNTSECKAKITAARLPYFDSDYWPGAAEVLLKSEDGSKPDKKGRNAVTERVLRAFRRDALVENPKDILLMYQLGENIRQMKEDFIMVHLWHVCKHCCHPILSGKQWVCSVCKNFQLCDKCFLLELNREMKDKHPTAASEKHSFHEVQVDNIAADTIDDDETIQSEIFDTRLIFLGHCQNNHYQFDSLRRAKHSTMMILHNLHNQFSPALASACIGCHIDIDTADGWHCSSCTGYDLCDSCYQKGAFYHEHELARSATVTDHNSQKCNQRKQVLSFQDLCGAPFLHASKCSIPRCTYPYCHKLKGLFHHSSKCQTRVNGGCQYCWKIWRIIHLHAQFCTEPECHAPRCKDLKEHLRKKKMQADSWQVQDDSRRRAGAKERMKERIRREKRAKAHEASDQL